MPALSVLRDLLQHVPDRVKQLPPSRLENKAAPSAWSPKEEFGHLIDSAANNHQRMVRTQFDNTPAMPGYEQNRWVAVHSYQQRDIDELIGIWKAFNQQLLAAAQSAPESAWSRTLTIAGGAPVTLEFVFDDYITHMMHHLRHMGIEVDDLASNRTNAA